jgi:hypothetical protein
MGRYSVLCGGLANVTSFTVGAESQVDEIGVVVVSCRCAAAAINAVFITHELGVQVQELSDQVLQPAELGFRRE